MGQGRRRAQFAWPSDSTTAALTEATQRLRRLARQLAKPPARFTERGFRRLEWSLTTDFVAQLLSCELVGKGGWRIRSQLDPSGPQRLPAERFGRTAPVTNRRDWSAAQVAQDYSGQQHVECALRSLKGGHWLVWEPLHHWTDDKIRVHAVSCMLGVSPLLQVRQCAAKVWPGLSKKALKQQLAGSSRSSCCIRDKGRRARREWRASPRSRVWRSRRSCRRWISRS